MSRARTNAPKAEPAAEPAPDPSTGLVPDSAPAGSGQRTGKAFAGGRPRGPRAKDQVKGQVRETQVREGRTREAQGRDAGAHDAGRREAKPREGARETAPAGPTGDDPADARGGRDAKTLILDTAERLFGQRGLADVSVREITSAAGVNVALVAYYFGSRDGLVRAVLDRLSIDLNRKRYAMLNAFKASGRPVGVREILEAYFAPALVWLDPEGPRRSAGEVVSRLFVDAPPEIRAKLEVYVRHHRVFVEELRAVVPELSFEDACWAFHFARGVLQGNTDLQLMRLHNVSEGLCNVVDTDGVLRRTVDFAACAIEAWAKRGPPE